MTAAASDSDVLTCAATQATPHLDVASVEWHRLAAGGGRATAAVNGTLSVSQAVVMCYTADAASFGA